MYHPREAEFPDPRGWLWPRDRRLREDALFRFLYSIMQINVRHIKLSARWSGAAGYRRSLGRNDFYASSGNESLPAPIFLPTWSSNSTGLLFHFVHVARSLRERRNFWRGASVTVGGEMKKGFTVVYGDSPRHVVHMSSRDGKYCARELPRRNFTFRVLSVCVLLA